MSVGELTRRATALAGVISLIIAATITFAPSASAATILQTSPETGTTTQSGSTGFSDQLEPTTDPTSSLPVEFSATGGADDADFSVTLTGGLSVVGGPLAAGSYTVTGMDTDGALDAGTWTYTLTVNPLEVAPNAGTTTVALSSGFTDQIEPTNNGGSTVTYLTGVTNPDLKVSNHGAVSTANGPLAAGPYTVSGTDSDTLGNTGIWSYTLTVSGGTITQTAPESNSTTTNGSGAFTDQLEPTTNGGSAVTFATTVTNPNLSVSPGGAVTTTTGQLAAGPYTVSGTDSDTLGDTGTWTYTLTVSFNPPPSPTGVTLEQGSPTSGSTTSAASASFSDGPLTVTNGTGAVTFVTTSTNAGLSVSTAGAIKTTGALVAGSYTVSGTDHDNSGDTGTWSYTLVVGAADVAVKFVANGGTGTMATELMNTPTALPPNIFTRAKHAFTDWNTAADGKGTSYANGATYAFNAPLTLYAQWVVISHVAKKHSVSFKANGGTGTMKDQSDNVLATLKSNSFTRTHYVFNDWNTAANDSGTSYVNGAAYNFKKSITLYAQWKIKPKAAHQVSFKANGGTGTMAPEAQNAPGHLSPNTFKRKGYTFARWNTSANNSGTSYVNDSAYSFKKSITLYAQWNLKPVVIIPPVDSVVTLSPFTNKSSVLSSALEAQVSTLAATVKTNHDTKIALVGYSGELTTSNELNEETWAASLKLALARAKAVETYLEQQLSALGVTGSVITTSGSTKALSPSSASQPANRKVVASLS